MADAAVAVNRLEALQVALQLAAEVALDRQPARRDGVDDGVELLGAQILGAGVRIDVCGLEDLATGAEADAVNVRQGGFDALVTGDVYAKESGHIKKRDGLRKLSPGAAC